MSLALFDFDHTITTVDTYGRFLRHIARPEQLARARWHIGPMLAGYRMGLVSAQRLRARVTRFAFQGGNEDDIREAGALFARAKLPAWLRPDMERRIGWHQSQGHTVVVVSGSLDVYLQPWCAERGLAVICNALEAKNGQLTGHYRDGDCGADKVRRIRDRYDIQQYQATYAYGDSREDRGMLALVQQRWYRGRRIA
ncbi:HAD family hydrolase [Pseudoxanthomonas sp. UTMC 1351]|uniref:HAD family hydrolase n=1 Tax=Pseudoxanthomonas sp. UTMC 1351 TaxID=2695853 RepID=UPI0034CFCD16